MSSAWQKGQTLELNLIPKKMHEISPGACLFFPVLSGENSSLWLWICWWMFLDCYVVASFPFSFSVVVSFQLVLRHFTVFENRQFPCGRQPVLHCCGFPPTKVIKHHHLFGTGVLKVAVEMEMRIVSVPKLSPDRQGFSEEWAQNAFSLRLKS